MSSDEKDLERSEWGFGCSVWFIRNFMIHLNRLNYFYSKQEEKARYSNSAFFNRNSKGEEA